MHSMVVQSDSEMPVLNLENLCPDPDIIISHDGKKILSKFEHDEWDLSPYSMSVNKEPKFSFVRVLKITDEVNRLDRTLIDEMKHILLVVLYTNRGGRFGCISVSTFRKYFYCLARMGRFCIKVNRESALEVICLKDLFSRAHIFNIFSKSNPDVLRQRNMVDTFNAIRTISQEYLGFKVDKVRFDEKIAREYNQHPVIPPDIYLKLVNGLSKDIEFFSSHFHRLTDFIAEFEDKAVGRTHFSQKSLGISKKAYRMTIVEVIEKHELMELFQEFYDVSSLASLITALMKIQFICLHTIVLYTGMRISEALNMPFDCLREEILTPAIFGDDGSVIVEVEAIDTVSCHGTSEKEVTTTDEHGPVVDDLVEVFSFTTKYTGIRESASWLANEDVKKAIFILQAINKGFAKSEQKEFDRTLFVTPNLLKGKSRVRSVFKRQHQPSWYSTLLIKQEDLDILRASNPEVKLKNEKFELGKPWPVTAHQFRRSLAYYAANSGFVSLPTLTVQFKHLVSDMTKYYCRNYESIKTIFGLYNPETNKFELRSEHTLFDFKEARIAFVVDSLINEVVDSEELLFGKSANYIQKQRAEIKGSEDVVTVMEVRRKTEDAVKKGEIYYRQTLLGGCTNVEQCDCRMLGEFTSCLSNACAVIKPQYVSEQISELTKYKDLLEPGTGEYQIVEEELNALITFQKREQGRTV